MDILPNYDVFLEATAPQKLLQNGYSLLSTLYFHDGNLTYRE